MLNVLSLVQICTEARECSIICKISWRLLHSFAPVLFELQVNPCVQPFTESNRQFEYSVVGGEYDDVSRGIENR